MAEKSLLPRQGSCQETLLPLSVGRNGNPAVLSVVAFSGHGKPVCLVASLHAMG